MAYTNTPAVSTISQHQLAPIPTMYSPTTLVGQPSFMSYVGAVNMLPLEYQAYPGADKQLIAVTRPPIIGTFPDGGPNTLGLIARGVYVWQKTSALVYYFVVFGQKVYTSTDNITWTNVTTLPAPTVNTPVGFTEFINDVNTKSLILVDGTTGYVFTSNLAGSKITDVDFPTPHLPFPVYIDGYLFLAKADTGDVYNSDLNNPSSWTAGSFLSSEVYPDDVKCIAKINNYLLAIGSQGCEYMYDSSNAVGTPIARVDGATHPFGTFFPYSVASNKDTLIMIANSNDGEASLQMIQDMQCKDITPPFLIPRLTQMLDNSVITYADVLGFFARLYGDLYYVLNVYGTMAFNIRLGIWVAFTFTSQENNLTPNENSQVQFPVTRATTCSSTSPVTYVVGSAQRTVGGVSASYPFFAKFTPGADGYTGTQTEVNGSRTWWGMKTPALSFGTLNKKNMTRLGLDIACQQSDDPVIKVEVNDFDFTTSASWVSTDTPMTLSAGDTDLNYPFVNRLGEFRKRYLKISGYSQYTCTFYGIELLIDKGQN